MDSTSSGQRASCQSMGEERVFHPRAAEKERGDHRLMIEANESFGHGRGACMGLSLDELAVIEHHLRVTTNALDAYYSQ
jgi:hypothetical protein